MNKRGELSPEDLRNVAYRIKACRILTWLNQEEFASKYNIPLPTLKCWEQSVVPRADGLQKIIEALKCEGVFIGPDWLMNGHGTGPAYALERAASNGPPLEEETARTNDFLNIFREKCRKARKNPITATVVDNEMESLFSQGDLIAGVLLDPSQIIADDCSSHEPRRPLLAKLENGLYAPRWVHAIEDSFYIRSNKYQALRRAPFLSFAEIHCHLLARMTGLKSDANKVEDTGKKK